MKKSIKKITAITSALLLNASPLLNTGLQVSAATIPAKSFSSGTGTKTNPFTIKTFSELLYLQNNSKSYSEMYFKLGADIEIPEGESISIPDLQGNFDGNDKTISYSGELTAPLFTDTKLFSNSKKLNSLTIKNLTIDVSNVTNVTSSAILCDQAEQIQIANVKIKSDNTLKVNSETGNFAPFVNTAVFAVFESCISDIEYNTTNDVSSFIYNYKGPSETPLDILYNCQLSLYSCINAKPVPAKTDSLVGKWTDKLEVENTGSSDDASGFSMYALEPDEETTLSSLHVEYMFLFDAGKINNPARIYTLGAASEKTVSESDIKTRKVLYDLNKAVVDIIGEAGTFSVDYSNVINNGKALTTSDWLFSNSFNQNNKNIQLINTCIEFKDGQDESAPPISIYTSIPKKLTDTQSCGYFEFPFIDKYIPEDKFYTMDENGAKSYIKPTNGSLLKTFTKDGKTISSGKKYYTLFPSNGDGMQKEKYVYNPYSYGDWDNELGVYYFAYDPIVDAEAIAYADEWNSTLDEENAKIEAQNVAIREANKALGDGEEPEPEIPLRTKIYYNLKDKPGALFYKETIYYDSQNFPYTSITPIIGDVTYGQTIDLTQIKYRCSGVSRESVDVSYYDLQLYAYPDFDPVITLTAPYQYTLENVLGKSGLNLTFDFDISTYKAEFAGTKVSFTVDEPIDLSTLKFNLYATEKDYTDKKPTTTVTGKDLGLTTYTVNDSTAKKISITSPVLGSSVPIEIPITLSTIQSVEVNYDLSNLDKADYAYGEKFDPIGLRLSITDYSGNKESIRITGTNASDISKCFVYGTLLELIYKDDTPFIVDLEMFGELIPPSRIEYQPSDPLEYEVNVPIDISDILFDLYNEDDELYNTIKGSDFNITSDMVITDPSVTELSVSGTLGNQIVNFTIPVKVSSKKTIKDIKIKSLPSKMTYIENENLDLTGLVLTASYTNGTQEDISNIVLDEPITLEYGTTEVNIGYQGNIFKITGLTVNRSPISSIFISEMPRTEYSIGEAFDPTGLVLSVYYEAGTSETITEGFTISPSGPLTLDNTKNDEEASEFNPKPPANVVIISYGGQSVKLPITLTAKVTSIEQKTAPLTYTVNQPLDLSNVEFNVTYEGESTPVVMLGSELGFSEITLTSHVSVVTLEARGVPVNINLVPHTATASITKFPDKMHYEVEDAFNPAGMIVTVSWSDGTQQQVTSFPELTNIEIESLTQEINFTIEGNLLTVPINSDPNIKNISVIKQPIKTTYLEGEVFNPTGMVLVVNYMDGTTKEIKDDFSELTYPTTALSKDNSSVKVRYQGRSVDIPINIIPSDSQLIAARLYKSPNKVDYNEGDLLEYDGLVIALTYEGCNYDYFDIDFSSLTEAKKMARRNMEYFTVSYGNGITVRVPVNVSAKEIVDVEIDPSSTHKIQYVVGDILNIKGLVLKVTYEDGTTALITDENIGFSGTYYIKSTTTMPVISYEGFPVILDLEIYDTSASIKTIKSIAVSSSSTHKTDYEPGDLFDTTGLVLTITYSDNSTEDITDITLDPSVVIQEGGTKVTINYKDKSVDIPITVATKTLEGVFIKSYPTKLTYSEGEYFDPTGMVLALQYEGEDDFKYVTDFKPLKDVPLTKDMTYVEITYAGKSFQIPITVKSGSKDIDNVVIMSYPTQYEYIDGDKFDPTGLILKVTYTDGTEILVGYKDADNDDTNDEDIVDLFLSLEPCILTEGTKSVSITYAGVTFNIPVSVLVFDFETDLKYIEKVTLQSPPSKTRYKSGEYFDPTGMSLLIEYNDGTKEVVETFVLPSDVLKPLTFSGSGASSEKQTITVTLTDSGDEKYSIDVEVTVINPDATRTIESVVKKHDPYKMDYIIGETFDPAGLSAQVKYSDGTSKLVTIDELATPITIPDVPSDQTVDITVYYEEAGQTFPLTVTVNVSTSIFQVKKELKNVEVVQNPRLTYFDGENFDTKDLELKLTYDNGDVVIIGNIPEPDLVLHAGDTQAIIIYKGFSLTFPVTVTDRIPVSVTVLTKPFKMDYIDGEYFDPKGMELLLTYEDNSTIIAKNITLPSMQVSAANPVVKFEYKGRTINLNINVTEREKVIKTVEVTKDPTKKEYIEGDKFEPAGMELTITYTDGSTEIVKNISSVGDIYCTSNQYVEFYYSGIKVRANIFVKANNKEVASVALCKSPTKTKYKAGTRFDPTGMTVTVTYKDGSTAEIGGITLESPITITDSTTSVPVSYKGFTVNVPIKVITGVSLKTPPAKTHYEDGETFNPAGMVLTMSFKDGTSEDISGLTFPNPITIKAGATSVTVLYEGFEIPVSITTPEPAKTVTSIAISKNPTKMEYFVGENLDTTGMEITVTYSDGTTKTVTDVKFSNPITFTDVVTSVTINYEGKSATLTGLTVKPVQPAATLSSIKVITPPAKMTYNEGEVFDASGMVLELTYSDGTKREVPNPVINSKTPLVAGTTTLTINYGGVDFTVTGLTVKAKTVTSVEIGNMPNKTTYNKGENLDLTGMTLVVTYSDGSTRTVKATDVFTDKIPVTSNKITLTYEGRDVELNLTIAAPTVTSVKLKTPPTKTNYIEGEAFNPAGMVLTVTYSDGTEEDAENITLPNSIVVKAGNTKVDIVYKEKTVSVPITVTAKAIDSITVSKQPTKTVYYDGDKFDPTGMEITITYNDKTTTVVSDLTFDDVPTLTAGTKTVDITYHDTKLSIPVTVKAKNITSVVVSKQPTKTKYLDGETFDPSGMEITVSYDNDTQEIIKELSLPNPPTLSAGTSVVTISYRGTELEIPVTVTAPRIESLEIKTNPTKLQYEVGDVFDFSGLVLEATYEDKSVKLINNIKFDDEIVITKDMTKIEFQYEDFDFEIPITVNVPQKTIKSMTLKTPPNKTKYAIGERFNPEGMAVLVVYDDDTEETITEFPSLKNIVIKEDTDSLALNFLGETLNVDIEVEGIVIDKAIKNVTMKQHQTKTKYNVGDKFDYTGLILEVTYEDDSKEEIKDYDFGDVTIKQGMTKLKVSYDEFSFELPIEVISKTVKSVAVNTPPKKTTYNIGDKFDPTGLSLKVTYSDGSTDIVTDLGLDDFVLDKATTSLTITYLDQKVSIPITVKAPTKTISKVEIQKQPTKTTYTAGETFDASGMVLKVTYTDGTYELVDNINLPNISINNGSTKVTINYQGFNVDVPITVVKKTISSVTINSYPKKTIYNVGEKFNSTGFSLKVTYSDKSTAIVSPDINVTFTEPTNNLVVNYEGFKVNIPVTVTANESTLISVAVNSLPSKTVYNAGDKFDYLGMSLLLTYSDGSQKIVSNLDFGDLTLQQGATEVKFKYDNFGFSIPIVVNTPQRTLNNLEIVSYPNKSTYKPGEKFDTTGLKMRATYSDGTTEIIDNFNNLPEMTIPDGVENVKFTYMGYTFNIPVTVESAKLTNIVMVSYPQKRVYVANEVFDPSGMLLQEVYSDGSSKYISEFPSLNTIIIKDGATQVNINYKGYSFAIPVSTSEIIAPPTEKTITNVEIKTLPYKTTYNVGEAFNSDGLSLLITYSDGSSEVITDVSVPAIILPVAQKGNIAVNYDGFTVNIPIEVKSVDISNPVKKVESVKVTSLPNNLHYYVNDKFDFTGMAVELTYNDGSVETVTDFSDVGDIVIKEGMNSIAVNFDSATINIPIINHSYNTPAPTDKQVSDIKVIQMPYKTDYKTGETFNPAGMVLQVTYNDGSKEMLKDFSSYTFEPFRNTASSFSLPILNTSLSIPINVEKSPETIDSDEVTTNEIVDKIQDMENKSTLIVQGDSFDTIDKEILEAIKDKGIELIVNTDKASIKIPYKNIPNRIKDTDLTINTNKNYIDSDDYDYLISDVEGYQQFSISKNLSNLNPTIQLEVRKGYANTVANVYGYNEDTGALEYIDSYDVIKLKTDKDGETYTSYAIDGLKASDKYTNYFITYTESEQEIKAPVKDETDKDSTSKPLTFYDTTTATTPPTSNTQDKNENNANSNELQYYNTSDKVDIGLGEGAAENAVAIQEQLKKDNNVILYSAVILSLTGSVILISYKKKKKK